MTQEAIDLILTAWTAPEPFDWHGEFWQGEKLLIIPQPLTKPHMEVGMACSRSEGTLELTAQKGFIPLLSWVPLPKQLKEMIEIYQRAGAEAHRPAPLSRVRVARMVYVTDSVQQAKHDLREVDLGAAKVTGRLNHYIPAGGTRDDLTMEYMIDQGAFFCGDPDTVYRGIKDFYDEIGGFGVLLLLAGKDWGTHEQRERSMRLFMLDVAPRLAILDADNAAAQHSSRTGLLKSAMCWSTCSLLPSIPSAHTLARVGPRKVLWMRSDSSSQMIVRGTLDGSLSRLELV